ncbi:hypothetical protein JW710_01690 [Candidatus Dojkabacteria bacterium]|nr:hypothetical protein [Candidatus Dojkabacteria bacterium]
MYSDGLAFILGRAQSLGKPVLALYKEGRDRKSSVVLEAFQKSSTKFLYIEYNHEILEQIVKRFISRVKKMIKRTHPVRLDPMENEFVEWYADHYNTAIVDVFRKLISEEMERNKDWKEYISF